MRLLNARTREMRDFMWHDIPPYAILSHTWGAEEVTLQDLQQSTVRKKAGFSKVVGCCDQAKEDGLDWVWIDTCCIDKTSSSELSEAINSMYQWYQNSRVCYVLLEDVPPLSTSFPEDKFRQARWFTRGWCLQELIAPTSVEFYASDWTDIGTKRSLNTKINDVTGIPSDILLQKTKLDVYSIAQKMSWASRRLTTRVEDEAYCLLGIFGIHMPLLYGEGERAFLRLQEEIMKRSKDYSLLLWTHEEKRRDPSPPLGVFAPSPRLFSSAGPYESTKGHCDYRGITVHFLDRATSSVKMQWNPPQLTSRGLRIQGFATDATSAPNTTQFVLWTGCMFKNQYICIILRRDDNGGVSTYSRAKSHKVLLVSAVDFGSFTLTELYLNADAHPRLSNVGIIQVPSRYWPGLSVIMTKRQKDSIISIRGSHPRIRFTKPMLSTKGVQVNSQGFVCQGVVSLRFGTHARVGAPEAYFTVDFGFGPLPWCRIRASPSTRTQDAFSDDEDAAMKKWYREQEENVFSDRATCQLPNECVVYAAAKAPGKPHPLSPFEGYGLHVARLV